MPLTPPPGIADGDFEMIEDAVLETPRGRWFLREFGRRARAADTSRMMQALARIERMLAGGESALDQAIAAENSVGAIEDHHRRLSEIAWTLRERGYDGDICTTIETEARALERLAKTLRGDDRASARLEPLAASKPSADAPPREGPPETLLALAAPIADNSNIADASSEDASGPMSDAAPVQALEATRDRRLAALAAIGRLPTRERLAFFA